MYDAWVVSEPALPIVIGLTGGIASGKSAVAALLRDRGAAVVDADQLARAAVAPGMPALAEIVKRFGTHVLTPDGQLDRAKLGAIVFHDQSARADLNRITHPRIHTLGQLEFARLAAAGYGVVFYEAALVVENKLHLAMPALIVVQVSPATQHERAAARDFLSPAEIDARIAAQAPMADKVAAATWVVNNDGTREQLAASVDELVAAITERFGSIRAREVPATPAIQVVRKGERALVTGFPAYTARCLVTQLLSDQHDTTLDLLVRKKFADDAVAFIAALPESARRRVTIVEGDVCDMDLGLSTREYGALCREVTAIYHLAGVYFTGVQAPLAKLINVAGTRGLLDFAANASNLRRVIHWSTAQVSGKRRGTVSENDLVHHAGFHNIYEQTKYEAEMLARAAMSRLPITVVRPGIIVGDSHTGAIDRLDGPYYLLVLIATNPSGLRLPLPGRGAAPLNLVPIDYVVAATCALARDQRAVGRTFHLVDPEPESARRVFELIAHEAHTQPPRAFLPGSLSRMLFKVPGLDRIARGQVAFLDSFDHPVTYTSQNTNELLGKSGPTCPRFESYVGALVRYVLDVRGRVAEPLFDADEMSDIDIATDRSAID